MKGFEPTGYHSESSGRGTSWNDINISALSLGTAGLTVPDLITLASTNIKARGFIGTGVTVQEGWGSLEILHGYKEGTDITPHIHWAPVSNAAGNVKWQLEYIWENNGVTLSTATTISLTDSAGGVAWGEKRSAFSAITGTGKVIGSRFIFRLFRDPADVADTYADYAVLLDFGIHYEIDTDGSRGMTSK